MNNILPSSDLEKYVQQGISAGVPREQTVSRLQQNGWQISVPSNVNPFNPFNSASSSEKQAAFDSTSGTAPDQFTQGAISTVKGYVAPPIKAALPIVARGFQAADYMASKLSGTQPTQLSGEQQQNLDRMTQEGLSARNIRDSLLTLSPLGGAKFSKLALPAAVSEFGISKMEGATTGEAAKNAAVLGVETRLLGSAKGPKTMAAIGSGLQAGNELAAGQNPLSAEGLGGITAAGGLGYLAGKAHEKGYSVGMSNEKSSGGSSRVLKGTSQSLLSQATGLGSEGQKAAFEPTTRGLVEGMLSGEKKPTMVVDRIYNALEQATQDVSNTGHEYDFVRTSTQVEPVPKDTFQATLQKYGMEFVPEGPVDKTSVLGNPIQNGHISVDPSGPGARMAPAAVDQIEAFMKFAGGVDRMTPEVFKQAKSFLVDAGNFYDPQLPGGGGPMKGLAGEMMSTFHSIRDNATSPDFQAYKALDAKYAPEMRTLDELKTFFEKSPTGEVRLKDSARGKILNSLKGNKNIARDLERISPGILREVRAHDVYQNIIEENKPGQYARALAKGAGAGYAIGGSPGAVVGGIAGIFASEPRVMFDLLSRVAKMKESFGFVSPEQIIFKAERGMKMTKPETQAIQKAAELHSTDQQGTKVPARVESVQSSPPTLPEPSGKVNKVPKKK